MSRSPVRLRAVTPAHLTSSAARPAAHPSGPGPRFPSISYQDPLRLRQRRRPVPLRSPRQRYGSWRTARAQRHCPRAHTAHPTAAIAKQGQAGTTDASITSTIAVIATAGTFRIQANAYYRTHAAHSPAIDICASGRSALEPLWNSDHLTLQAGPRASAYQSLPATLASIDPLCCRQQHNGV